MIRINMAKQKNFGIATLIVSIIIAAIIAGVAVYFFLEYKQPIIKETKLPKYQTIEEYILKGTEEIGHTVPKDLVRVEIDGIPVNIAPSHASAPISIYTLANWENTAETETDIFYLKFDNPMYSLEEPNVARHEFWSGPFSGNLQLLLK
ncbi:hypothetical protein COT97_03620 [Candidatus Falkowbacteria bacterium CG10_big_fil_rev_8_21_14_0_10_39_11]|uniref:Uncharacterized protein n=1 Tax=Candidatus Falkowbacteria bacterium CG10_big_fil_rev_8_21_14_0_10_39_11 TaxID=1974565 RepID=A0A2H0V6N4_9BACT|nr:MAG: hypothetical protein COT97_03620 [Candidatus Falkowbacteria bacterium CG10_big_fil_rev_8_21_14_0_10_39_11]